MTTRRAVILGASLALLLGATAAAIGRGLAMAEWT